MCNEEFWKNGLQNCPFKIHFPETSTGFRFTQNSTLVMEVYSPQVVHIQTPVSKLWITISSTEKTEELQNRSARRARC